MRKGVMNGMRRHHSDTSSGGVSYQEKKAAATQQLPACPTEECSGPTFAASGIHTCFIQDELRPHPQPHPQWQAIHLLIPTLTHAPTHSLTHPLAHSLTRSLTHPHSLTHPGTRYRLRLLQCDGSEEDGGGCDDGWEEAQAAVVQQAELRNVVGQELEAKRGHLRAMQGRQRVGGWVEGV